ncbi:MAG: peptidase [Chitinivibrionia bacterium]|nr:peptidase [Chitinivibrionia bacterium]
MSLMKEYLGVGVQELQDELLNLITRYNKLTGRYLFVYSASPENPIPQTALERPDYYVIHDLLSPQKVHRNLDFFIQTPGGSGETAEDIVKFLHSTFDTVNFVVSGEAKSAGTIMVLSGHEILMTETGSLGPIDAQVQLGRSTISAYDYMEWVKSKQAEAANPPHILNPVDAVIIAQITPGELSGVNHALKFAEDLVIEWLPKYKFRDWNLTEKNKTPVTDEMKKSRAAEIAQQLCNHSKWRSHGRSIKIEDLLDIGLKVICIDDNPDLADVVYRIHTVTTFLYVTTSTYKIFATESDKIFKHASKGSSPAIPGPAFDSVEITHQCSHCGKVHQLYAKFIPDPKIDEKFRKDGRSPFPGDARLKCECGFETDLSGLKNEIETNTGKKMVT